MCSSDLIKGQKAQKGTFLRGRQIFALIIQHVVVAEADGEMIELRDLFDVRLHGDDLRGFQTEWVFKSDSHEVNVGIKETLLSPGFQTSGHRSLWPAGERRPGWNL